MMAEYMISGEWIIALLVAVIPLIGGVWVKAKKAGERQANASRDVTLREPLPDVGVRRVFSPPSFSQHMEVVRRVETLEKDVREIRRENAEQFRKLLEVGESRKDTILQKLEDTARAYHARVDELLRDGRKTPK